MRKGIRIFLCVLSILFIISKMQMIAQAAESEVHGELIQRSTEKEKTANSVKKNPAGTKPSTHRLMQTGEELFSSKILSFAGVSLLILVILLVGKRRKGANDG
ncbi:hypothetical protein QUW13_05075 [Enterococcus hirae]|nr:hypothetical protein [Enterococcus hirae]